MTNGHTTEWRLEQLEARMDRMEGWVIRGAVAAIGNLLGLLFLIVESMLRR